jgi:transcription antitermination factor NusG
VSLIDMKWYALHVRPNWETRVSRALAMKGYEVFSPTLTLKKVRRGRVAETRVPMFASYVFCRYRSTITQRIVESRGVVRIVGCGHTPTPVDDSEMASIQTVYASGLHANPAQFFTGGQRIRVVSGVLRGVEGQFVRDKDGGRVIVNVTLLQRSLMVELDDDWIAALPEWAARPAAEIASRAEP